MLKYHVTNHIYCNSLCKFFCDKIDNDFTIFYTDIIDRLPKIYGAVQGCMLFVQKYSHQNVSNCKILASLPEERERERVVVYWSRQLRAARHGSEKKVEDTRIKLNVCT